MEHHDPIRRCISLSLVEGVAIVASQMAALGIDPAAPDQTLHIGCGKNHLEGWINTDVYPAPLALNVLLGLPIADGSVRFVVPDIEQCVEAYGNHDKRFLGDRYHSLFVEAQNPR